MSRIIFNLQEAIEKNNESEIIKSLKILLDNSSGKDDEDVIVRLEDNKIAKEILNSKNPQIIKLGVELVAEWSKTEINRKLLTESTIIESLLKMLQQQTVTDDDVDVILGAIRALCNICYENDEARCIIGSKGLDVVLSLLNSAEDDSRKTNNIIIITKASGFLVNLLNNNDDLQKLALKHDVLTIVENLLKKHFETYNDNISLFTFLLAILNSIIDYVDGVDQNIEFKESLCHIIIDIFKCASTSELSPEISVMCLEILHSQSDKENMKSIMAHRATCQLVIELIEKYRGQVSDEDESRSIMKMACDLIVIILTGDDCMNFLYDNGNGKVYQSMITWLESSNDPDLLSTGVLAIGNFARKDTNCIQMVNNGLSKKLIDLLSKYNNKQSDIKVQHALLSTLKNLVIPQENKAKILNEGLIEIIYPMIEIEQPLVIFKLLGTFRMVIDGQEKTSMNLLSRKEFLEKLISWCYNSDHLGIRGEVPRLLAWLIKHSPDSFQAVAFKNCIEVKNVVKCLVEMSCSNHPLMQNEAFFALNRLYLGSQQIATGERRLLEDEFCKQLIDSEIAKNLYFVCNKYADKMDANTIQNLLNLFEHLLLLISNDGDDNDNRHLLIEHLKNYKLDEILSKQLNLNPNNSQEICEKLKNLTFKFDN